MHTTLLLVHICSATVGLLSGFMAMAFRKGSNWHGAAGTVFFVSMLLMSSSGAYIAAFLKPVAINVVAATLTFYLVSTAWRAAKKRDDVERVGLAASVFRRAPGRRDEIERQRRGDDIDRDRLQKCRDIRAARGHQEHRDEENRSGRAVPVRAFAECHGHETGQQSHSRGADVQE